MKTSSAVSLLDRDPDLGEDLGPEEFAVARQHAVVRLVGYQKGAWSVPRGEFDAIGSLGLMVIEGMLVRKVTVGERACAELLGPGDVTQPWLKVGTESSVDTEVSWQVPQTLRLAVLDRAFALRVARWPEIPAAVARRVMLRVYWLSFHLAVCHMRRVDDRLMLVLWHFADRWGRVTPQGIKIPLPLTHSLLALVVGAHRPSVTSAVRGLIEAGHLQRCPHSQWLLSGKPPEELRGIQEYAARYDRPAPLAISWLDS
jgi:CRP/FNR family transcriptional regulator, cyclic AMP receptor protein